MIPEAAVEAAAKAFYELGFGSWEGAHADTRGVQMEDMRAALEAAAPHMLAGAWDEGMNAMYDSTSSEWPPIPDANPYRPTQ